MFVVGGDDAAKIRANIGVRLPPEVLQNADFSYSPLH